MNDLRDPQTNLPAVAPPSNFELTVNARRFELEANNRTQIIKFINTQLKDGQDFGTIPGVDKKMLFQPGAQKILALMGVYADPAHEVNELANGHREYLVRVALRHMGTDTVVASGYGSCSTMESKYRYRNAYEDTGKLLPRGYWDLKKRDAGKAQESIGGKGFKAMKADNGQWHIFQGGGKSENPDIADVYNTVLKIAIKRASVAATLSVCGGWSDQFDDPTDPEPPRATQETEPASDFLGGSGSKFDKDEMKLVYATWTQQKKDEYNELLAKLKGEGMPPDEAVREAFDAVNSVP